MIQVVLEVGTVVLVRGVPMRLVTNVVVESRRENFEAAGLIKQEEERP